MPPQLCSAQLYRHSATDLESPSPVPNSVLERQVRQIDEIAEAPCGGCSSKTFTLVHNLCVVDRIQTRKAARTCSASVVDRHASSRRASAAAARKCSESSAVMALATTRQRRSLILLNLPQPHKLYSNMVVSTVCCSTDVASVLRGATPMTNMMFVGRGPSADFIPRCAELHTMHCTSCTARLHLEHFRVAKPCERPTVPGLTDPDCV